MQQAKFQIMGFLESFMKYNSLLYHQSRLMEFSGVCQLLSFYSFGYWALLKGLYPNSIAKSEIVTSYLVVYSGMILIAIQKFHLLRMMFNINTGLYPTPQSIKTLRTFTILNGYILLIPVFNCLITIIDSLSTNYSTQAIITATLGSFVVGSQFLLSALSSYLHMYYKLPFHQGIGRFDRNSQMAEFALVIFTILSNLVHIPQVTISIGLIIGTYLCRRSIIMPSFQSSTLCQLQMSIYMSYISFMLIQFVLLFFVKPPISGFVFSIVQTVSIFYLSFNVSKEYIKTFLPDVLAVKLTQSFLKGQISRNDYLQKLPLLVPMINVNQFITSIHFLSNFNLVEELESDNNTSSNNSSNTSSRTGNENYTNSLMNSRYKGHFLLSNTVFNCLVIAESRFDNCAILKCHIVRYNSVNFGMIEERGRAMELENQIALGKPTILSGYTLVLVSTFRLIKAVVEISCDNDIMLLMKKSHEQYCKVQIKTSAALLYGILKALQSGNTTKFHFLSFLFVKNAQESFSDIKQLFQKFPQDACTLRLLILFLDSIENDYEMGEYVLKTMEAFDLSRGVERDILDVSAVDEEDSEGKTILTKEDPKQQDYVGNFLLINENMKKERFALSEWQTKFRMALKISAFVIFVAILGCIFFNGYLLIDFFGLQLQFSQIASLFPFKRQKADASYFQRNPAFTQNLLDLEDTTTDLIYMGRLDNYDTIQYLDTSTTWGPLVINETHYTLIHASFLDVNLDHSFTYINPLLPDDFKNAFISFATISTSVSQIVRLQEYHAQLYDRLSSHNLIYFEYTFLPFISSCIAVIFIILFIYVKSIGRFKTKLLEEICAKSQNAIDLATKIKENSFKSTNEYQKHFNIAIDLYNLKFKERFKGFVLICLLGITTISVAGIILFLIFTTRQDAMEVSYFESNIATSAANILFAFYHIQSLGNINISAPHLVRLHNTDFGYSLNYSLSLMSASLADMAFYIRDPYFSEFTNKALYKSLLLDPSCNATVCEPSLSLQVNSFARMVEECLANNCNNLKDILDISMKTRVWTSLENALIHLIDEDLLTRRRLLILLPGIALTIAFLFCLYILLYKIIIEKEQALGGFMYLYIYLVFFQS